MSQAPAQEVLFRGALALLAQETARELSRVLPREPRTVAAPEAARLTQASPATRLLLEASGFLYRQWWEGEGLSSRWLVTLQGESRVEGGGALSSLSGLPLEEARADC